MKKFVSLTLAVLMVLSLLSGCGGSSSVSADRGYAEPAAPAVKEEMAVEVPMMMATGTVANDSIAEAGQSVPNTEQKLIKTIRMEAETEDLDALLPQISAKISALGGYVENQELYNGSSYSSYRYRNANLTVRIPAEQLNGFVEDVKGVSNVVSYNESTENVTLQYVSTESRMKALEVEQERLLELLAKAENMSDLLEIEARLTDVRYELESVTSQLRVYDNLVDYATINLNIEEVQEYTPVAEETLWQRISGGFMDSLEGVGNFFVELFAFLIISLPYLALIAAVIALIVFLCKRSAKKRRAKRAACPPPVYPPYPPQNMPPAQGDNQQ